MLDKKNPTCAYGYGSRSNKEQPFIESTPWGDKLVSINMRGLDVLRGHLFAYTLHSTHNPVLRRYSFISDEESKFYKRHTKTIAGFLRKDCCTTIIDIDNHSNSSPKEADAVTQRVISELGQPFFHERNIESGGAHLYYYDTEGYIQKHKSSLKLHFQNQNIKLDFRYAGSSAIRLPLSHNYVAIDENGNPYRSLEMFLDKYKGLTEPKHSLKPVTKSEEPKQSFPKTYLTKPESKPEETKSSHTYGAGERVSALKRIVFFAIGKGWKEQQFKTYALEQNQGSKDYSSWDAAKIDADLSYWYQWGKRNFKPSESTYYSEFSPENNLFNSNVTLLSSRKKRLLIRLAGQLSQRKDIPKLGETGKDLRNMLSCLLLEVYGRMEYEKTRRRRINSTYKFSNSMKDTLLEGYQFSRKWQNLFGDFYSISGRKVMLLYNWLVYDSELMEILKFSDGSMYRFGYVQSCRRIVPLPEPLERIEKEYSICVLRLEREVTPTKDEEDIILVPNKELLPATADSPDS